MVDINQSTLEIPSLSNFVVLKNGKDVVNGMFEEDLMMMKKLQRESDVQKLRNRVDNQLSYVDPSTKLQNPTKTSKTPANAILNNPTLQTTPNPTSTPNPTQNNNKYE